MRTFVVGLKSQTMRHILYSRTPGTLAEAFTIAQTVHYDHQHTQMDLKFESQGHQARLQQKQSFQSKFNTNYNKPIQYTGEPRIINKPEFVKKNENKQENWRQQYTGEPLNNHGNWRQPNLQQSHRIQRINQLQNEEPQELNGISNEELQTIPDDLISNSSAASTSSAFLDE